ncbi:MAG: hypothetical protein V1494_03950 [Candidatus Diapherotrites archaeon]
MNWSFFLLRRFFWLPKPKIQSFYQFFGFPAFLADFLVARYIKDLGGMSEGMKKMRPRMKSGFPVTVGGTQYFLQRKRKVKPVNRTDGFSV